MDFTRKIRIKAEKTSEIKDLEALYPHNVLLYNVPPMQDISIQSFEELVIERLKVLRILEQASSKNLRYQSDEWKESIIVELNLQKLKSYARLIQGSNSKNTEVELHARRNDYVSHFLMRLVYCRSQDLRKWFITREMELFRLKFMAMTTAEITKFLEVNHLEYTPLTEDQKNDVKDGLYESTIGQSVQKIEMLDFYKVHFLEVLDLVRSRKCYLKKGYAYVNTNDFVSIVASKQESLIDSGLKDLMRLLPEIENDERLCSLIKGLHTSYTGKDFTLTSSAKIPIECVDQLSKKSFPLCMRSCHETLRIKHHHKYGGRMQYGLFLKGIGMTLEDSLRFWQEEFVKVIDLDKFNKEYRYNIRHNYGKEGSMTNYTPYSCIKIITSSVGAQDTHGCPFKLLDNSALKQKLTSYGLGGAHVQEITTYANKGHYQIACAKYFEIMHETKLETGITHPNQYFELSQTVMGNRATTKPGPRNNQNQAKKSDDLVLKKNKAALLDGNYDEELWNVAEQAQSQLLEESIQMEWNEELDISQVDNY